MINGLHTCFQVIQEFVESGEMEHFFAYLILPYTEKELNWVDFLSVGCIEQNHLLSLATHVLKHILLVNGAVIHEKDTSLRLVSLQYLLEKGGEDICIDRSFHYITACHLSGVINRCETGKRGPLRYLCRERLLTHL